MENKCFKDSDRELLSKYLDACVSSKTGRKQEARSVYKYKPVALKTKPVIGELLGEFRIQREIIGDPLERCQNCWSNHQDLNQREGILWSEKRK